MWLTEVPNKQRWLLMAQNELRGLPLMGASRADPCSGGHGVLCLARSPAHCWLGDLSASQPSPDSVSGGAGWVPAPPTLGQ